jgi:hypothetical protein
MPSTAQELVEEFVAKGWKSNPFDKLVPLLANQREQALPLALMIIERVPKGGTFFDLLLSHLTETEFGKAIEVAVERLGSGPAEVLNSVFAYGALQFPGLLTPHLRALFTYCPNAGTYYEQWPWRGADEAEIRRLQEIVTIGADPADGQKAWNCLVETRRPDCLKFVAEHLPPGFDDGNDFAASARSAGFDTECWPPRKLHSEASYHLIFPVDYFDDSRLPAWIAHSTHPSWTLKGITGSRADFGGVSRERCGVCGGPLHRMIRLDHGESILGIRLPQVELCTCLSCLGWEAPDLFFSHDPSGIPTPWAPLTTFRKPQFPAVPLKAAAVAVIRSPPRWQFQDWALSNSRENLNRVGGSPCWIQGAQYPTCPQCGELMRFIAQLDSDIPTSSGGEWLWGSGGIGYFFWCDPCVISGSLWQCT